MKLTLIALLIPAASLAGNAPKSPPSAPTHITNGANSASVAASWASSEATAAASQTQTATGSAEQSQTAEGGSASNEGNTLSSSYTERRQAPSVGQGSLAIVGCGAGGNAGGSNSGGAAFFGIQFITPECHGWMLAQTYLALGDRVSACQVANSQKAAKRAVKRGAKLPDCNALPEILPPVAAPPVTVNVQAPDLSKLATKDEVERAFGRSVAK